ncbi:MAG: uroporphyrinogen decarboxylase family protein [Spirosomataceae bacterium]
MLKTLQPRRDFLKTLSVLAATTYQSHSLWATPTHKLKVDKRQAIFDLIQTNKKQEYVPCGFFVHFGEGYKTGDAAVNRHLEYFNAIDMDFIKVQYESEFPKIDLIKQPSDWANMPFYKKDFYEKQLYVVKELVKKGKKLAPVIVTLYSPFMSAGHSVGGELLTKHLKQDPEAVKKGLDIITESTLLFANECIKLGVDGFLAATQGGEGFRFRDPAIFANYVKPYDLVVMKRINEATPCNILHICDFVSDYDDLTPFLDYPGHIVNCSLKINSQLFSTKDIYKLFKRPVFGGMEKKGSICTSNTDLILENVKEVIQNAPEKFILGAECALPCSNNWQQIRQAVDMAHTQRWKG